MKKRGQSRYAAGDLKGAAKERPARTKKADSRAVDHRKLMAVLRAQKRLAGDQEVTAPLAAGVMPTAGEREFLEYMAATTAPQGGPAKDGQVVSGSFIPIQTLEQFTRGAERYYDALQADLTARRAAAAAAHRTLRGRENSIGSYWAGAYGLPSGAQTNLTSFQPMASNLQYAPLTLQWLVLMYAYTTFGILQRAIDVPVYDAFRGGLDLESNEITDSSDLEAVSEQLEERGLIEAQRDGNIWARLFGGGALIFNCAGEDYSAPFDPDKLKQGQTLEIYDASRWELGSESRIPMSGFYDFYGLKVHKSRVMTIAGKRAPFLIRDQLAGWGLSEIQRMSEDFNGYMRTKNAKFELMLEAKVDVFKVQNYKNQLASPMAGQLTNKRIQQANQAKSFWNAILLDKDDDYQQKQISFSGIAEMARENRMDISEAMNMPPEKIWGPGAVGTGEQGAQETANEIYNSMVEAVVREPNKPRCRRILKVLVQTMFGAPLHISFGWKPLRVLGSVEQEAVNKSITDRIMANLEHNLISPEDALAWQKKARLIPIAVKQRPGFADLGGTPEAPEAAAERELRGGDKLTVGGADTAEGEEGAVGYEAEGKEPPPVGFAGGAPRPQTAPGQPGSQPGDDNRGWTGAGGGSAATPWPEPQRQLTGAREVKGPGSPPAHPERLEQARK